MSLKAVSLLILGLSFSSSSFATIANCSRKDDKTNKTIGVLSDTRDGLILSLTEPLAASYLTWETLPAGNYNLDNAETIEAVLVCHDAPPSAVVTTQLTEDGISINIEETCFRDPHVSISNYELVCR